MRLTFCALCGVTEGLEHHHVVPRSEGGADVEENLLTLCGTHHGMLHGIRRTANISKLTKAALAALKARGVKLGPKKANTAAAHAASRERWARWREKKNM